MRRRALLSGGPSKSTTITASLSATSFAGCGAAIAFSHAERLTTLSPILGLAAVIAGLLVAGERGGLGISGGFIVAVLAAALLGAASATAAAVITELTATAVMRTRWRAVLLLNLPAAAAYAVVPALIIDALTNGPADNAAFYLAVALGGVASLLVSFALFTVLRRAARWSEQQFGLDTLVAFLPSGALSVLVAVAGVAIQLKVGNAGIAFALAAVFVFSYMSHLLEQSRARARQYAALSWGVLGGLMRSLDVRDERAARHAAAVARFSRDIAHAVGMSAAEQELAHTAGLLHDIGRFALSDRVAERGRTLTDEDWLAIQRHPELGADMLRDLGIYGPVAEIVLCHHERVDGRGYPNGLAADEIPEIAKIVSVAEVYDTLTASDTYRTPMSSFEALNELRRVSGSQVDRRYVEALSGLLSGEGVDYRHANAADFDHELDIERRISSAGSGG